MKPRPCDVCGAPDAGHLFENVDGVPVASFCDDHCPRCWAGRRVRRAS